MDSVKKAAARLRNYPTLLTLCADSAAVYARCVAQQHENVKKNLCKDEFVAFKKCLNEAAKKIGTKI
ncbi:hypothetical protein QYM36_010986 [Artemia franciscana]|uniref:Uncharacterized protein n=1 Tax=Artemia franciscana TaxID=6661 RepID=A0AA88HHL6_ARTSF|nr:hypothetical protein QYM36_010986 [Artemia franciscana]